MTIVNDSLLAHIRIVLVAPSHPGNIGACARAMKNMGLQQLYLVNPASFPHADATFRASGADNILEQAKVTSSLEEAIYDCHLAIATSARSRSLAWPELTIEEAAKHSVEKARDSQIAFVFGAERTGLTNSQLQTCHYLLQIPCNPDFASLNLAAAVQIVCYEIRKAVSLSFPRNESFAVVTSEQMESFYQQLESSLINLQFLDPKNPRLLMQRLRRLFNRTHLDPTELNILRGILKAVSKR